MEYKKAKWEIEYDKYNENKDELKSKMTAIRREQATLKEGPEYAAKKKELEELKKTQIKYNKIEKNKAKIENILNLKKALVNQTYELLDEKSEIDKIDKKIKVCEKELEKLDEQSQDILNGLRQIDEKLKDPNLKEEDRNKLLEERKQKIDCVKENNTKYSETAKAKDILGKKLETFDKDKINEQLLKNEKLISKCDLIGANLIKGKSMEEISASLSSAEFTPNKDFANKVKAMKEMYRREQGDQEQDRQEQEGQGQDAPEQDGQDAPEQDEQEQDTHPTKVGWFSKLRRNIKEHGFFKGIINSFKKEEQDQETPEQDVPEQDAPEQDVPEQEPPVKADEDFEYAMTHLDGKEQDEVLKEITEKGVSGFRESIKVKEDEVAKKKQEELRAKLAKMREEAEQRRKATEEKRGLATEKYNKTGNVENFYNNDGTER